MKVLCTLIIALVSIPFASADDSLLVYLSFDDKGDIAKDITGNGNEGQFVVVGGGKVQWVDGKFDRGIELDGQSYVDIPWSDSIDVADGSFTVEIWFNYTEVSAAGALVWGYHISNGFWIRTEPGSNRIRGLIAGNGGWGDLPTEDSYNDGEWHHLAFVRNTSQDTLTFYIDGEVDGSRGVKAGSITMDHPIGIYLGRKFVADRPDSPNLYKGILDEFRLWKRALSQDEIKANMNKGAELVLAVQPDDHLATTWGDTKADR